MTSARPYQTLSFILFALSAVAGLAALVLIFAPGWLLTWAPAGVSPPNTNFEHSLTASVGVFALVLSYLLCCAARDPVRNVAIVNAMIFFCVAAAALNLYALAVLGLGAFYPAGYLITRAIIQLMLAGVIFALRPKSGGRLPAH